MIYKAVLGEVKIGREEELREQAKRKVKAKQEELETANEVAARIQKEYDELLESEVIKDRSCGWITIGGSAIGECGSWSIGGKVDDD